MSYTTRKTFVERRSIRARSLYRVDLSKIVFQLANQLLNMYRIYVVATTGRRHTSR